MEVWKQMWVGVFFLNTVYSANRRRMHVAYHIADSAVAKRLSFVIRYELQTAPEDVRFLCDS